MVKKLPLLYQIVTKTYLPTYLCNSSDSCDICGSSDSNDSSDSIDSSGSSYQYTFFFHQKTYFPKKFLFHKKKFQQKNSTKKTQKVTKLKNSKCEKTYKTLNVTKLKMWQLKMCQNSKPNILQPSKTQKLKKWQI